MKANRSSVHVYFKNTAEQGHVEEQQRDFIDLQEFPLNSLKGVPA